jgi:hypothetical protein
MEAHSKCSNNFEENPSENQYKFNSSVRNLSGYQQSLATKIFDSNIPDKTL